MYIFDVIHIACTFCSADAVTIRRQNSSTMIAISFLTIPFMALFIGRFTFIKNFDIYVKK